MRFEPGLSLARGLPGLGLFTQYCVIGITQRCDCLRNDQSLESGLPYAINARYSVFSSVTRENGFSNSITPDRITSCSAINSPV
jgi:hypothetical protein